MEEFTCNQDGKISQLLKTVNRIDKEIFGNGTKGLSKDFVELKTQFEDMNEDVKKIATSVSALAQSQVEQDTIRRMRLEGGKHLSDAIQRVGTIAAIITGIVGMVYVILQHFN